MYIAIRSTLSLATPRFTNNTLILDLNFYLSVHVSRWINTFFWELGDLDVESGLDLLQNLFVLLGGDQRDGQTLGTESTGSTDSVQVLVGLVGQVVVDGQIDSFDIDTSTKHIGGNTDTLVELLERFVSLDSLFLRQSRVDGDGREVTSAQQLVQLVGSLGGSDEDDDLVEFQRVQQVRQLSVLFLLLQLDVVLLQTMQGQLGFVVNVDLQWVLHELLTDGTDFLRQGGGKHHHLLLVRGVTEDVLDVSSHVDGLQDLVTLVNDERLDVSQTDGLFLDQRVQSTGGGHDDMGTSFLALQFFDVSLDWGTSVKDFGLDVGHVLRESGILVTDLVRQFSGVTDDQGGDLTGNRV